MSLCSFFRSSHRGAEKGACEESRKESMGQSKEEKTQSPKVREYQNAMA
jgi:hypothetical protein